MNKPTYLADRILDQLHITNPQDLLLLEDIAWQRGALVREAYLDGAEARLLGIADQAVITVSTQVTDPRRRRFSIAHELGHLERKDRGDLLRSCSGEDIDCWHAKSSRAKVEILANEFAAALLLPERFFAHKCTSAEPSLDLMSDLAAEFDVSLTATARRYTSFCQDPIAIVFSENGHIKWFQGSPEFHDLQLFIDVGQCLHSASIADRIFEGKTTSNKLRRVPASSWLASGQYRSDAVILEQSWSMPNYNAVLTLLWIDDDIEDDIDEDPFYS